jgi:hypothetical protein
MAGGAITGGAILGAIEGGGALEAGGAIAGGGAGGRALPGAAGLS